MPLVTQTSRMKRSLILALKVAVLAALITIIFYAIDWRDSYSQVSDEGETLAQVEGLIADSYTQLPLPTSDLV